MTVPLETIMKPLEAITALREELDGLKAEAEQLRQWAVKLETANAWLERERDEAVANLAICRETNRELRQVVERLETLTPLLLVDGGS